MIIRLRVSILITLKQGKYVTRRHRTELNTVQTAHSSSPITHYPITHCPITLPSSTAWPASCTGVSLLLWGRNDFHGRLMTQLQASLRMSSEETPSPESLLFTWFKNSWLFLVDFICLYFHYSFIHLFGVCVCCHLRGCSLFCLLLFGLKWYFGVTCCIFLFFYCSLVHEF